MTETSFMTYRQAEHMLQQIVDAILNQKSYPSKYFDWHINVVTVVHEEGTTCVFKSAALIDLSEQWIGVITEHQGNHVFSKDELIDFGMYKRIDNFSARNILKRR